MAKVLISGGNGLLGRKITEQLKQKGYEVSWLLRHKPDRAPVKTYLWDPVNKTADAEAFRDVKHIIHLSGSSIAAKPWTRTNKNLIRDSRVNTAEFLYSCCKTYAPSLLSFTGASAIGYYGSDTGEQWMNEEDSPGTGFMAGVCLEWEKAYAPFAQDGIRTVIIRIGLVLSPNGGFYAALRTPFKLGLGAVPGKGKNYYSWIHEQDLAEIFCFSIQHEFMRGCYNAVSSKPMPAKNFLEALARSFSKRIWLPHVPAFLLRTVLGERSLLALGGNRVSNLKLKEQGFRFHYDDVDKALENLRSQ